MVVRNQGPAIPPDLLPLIFEPFRRGPPRPGSRPGGLGLGLYIAHHIVLAHGGKIGVESSEEGTVFSVRLPRTG
jgi:signal transduction histidine kinase